MKIVDTDNYDGDYPNEKVIASGITNKDLGEVMVDALNAVGGVRSARYYKLVEDDYVLQPGFQP